MGVQLAQELESLRANRAELRLAAIVESSDDAIVSKDLDGTIRSWNSGAERIFGYTAAEIIGKSIRTIIPADRQAEEDDVLARISRGEKVDHFETIRRRKDGSEVDISVTVSPMKDASGKVIGASKVARDIADKKLAERILQDNMAVKDQFLSLVSHELRTPISTILGNGKLLLQRGDTLQDEDKRQALTDVVSEAERLQRIIENLLVLSRMDASRELRAEPILLSKLVGEEIDAFRRRSTRPVSISIEDDLPIAVGEEGLVRQVVENLLGNADKYSSKEADAIEVVLRRTEAGWPEVRVLDHGIGFDSTDLRQLFTPFYRTEAAMRFATGMGLGLAVCKRIIEAQGGTIVARAREGGGSEFAFSLPPAAVRAGDERD
jgi:PAS domain S-box-containing protein